MSDYAAIWQALTTQVYRLLNADSENGDRARVRRYGGAWLYHDEQDGYQVVTDADVVGLMMEEEGP